MNVELLGYLAGLFCLGLLIRFISGSSKKLPKNLPYIQKQLLTKTEAGFYWKLIDSLPSPDFIVCVQVSLGQLLAIKKGANHQEWFNRICRMSVDYVICRPDFSVLVAIELDDSSHDAAKRKKADAKKALFLQSAGIRLLRYTVKDMPSVEALKQTLTGEATPPLPSPV